jgi:DNA-binding response OmpR family regulator
VTRVLVVDDEPPIVRAVAANLRVRGYEVLTAASGESALAAVETHQPDCIVLDLGLPGIDGLEVLRRLRTWTQIPVVVLTAVDGERDKVTALDLGADDYVTKPFSPRELVARVKAVLRRTEPEPETGPEPPMHLGSLTVDPARHEVSFEGRPVQLTAREFELLSYLVRNRGLVLTRDQILERVWGYAFPADTRTVDVHIRQLRAKLGERAPIVTIRGVGYKADDRGDRDAP